MTPTQKVEVLRACCCVAGASGGATDRENVIVKRLAGEVGVGRASLNAMIDRAESDPEFYKEKFRVLKGDPQETMVLLLQVAMADGVIEDSETKVLRELAANLEVPTPVFEELLTKAIEITNKQ